MKRFYIESGIQIAEWEKFENLILDQTREFHFTQEQWKNRRTGRTQITPQERIAMMSIVEEMRKQPVKRSKTLTAKFIN